MTLDNTPTGSGSSDVPAKKPVRRRATRQTAAPQPVDLNVAAGTGAPAVDGSTSQPATADRSTGPNISTTAATTSVSNEEGPAAEAAPPAKRRRATSSGRATRSRAAAAEPTTSALPDGGTSADTAPASERSAGATTADVAPVVLTAPEATPAEADASATAPRTRRSRSRAGARSESTADVAAPATEAAPATRRGGAAPAASEEPALDVLAELAQAPAPATRTRRSRSAAKAPVQEAPAAAPEAATAPVDEPAVPPATDDQAPTARRATRARGGRRAATRPEAAPQDDAAVHGADAVSPVGDAGATPGATAVPVVVSAPNSPTSDSTTPETAAPESSTPRRASTALLFQAPDTTVTRTGRRRAQSPAGPPKPATVGTESQTPGTAPSGAVEDELVDEDAAELVEVGTDAPADGRRAGTADRDDQDRDDDQDDESDSDDQDDTEDSDSTGGPRRRRRRGGRGRRSRGGSDTQPSDDHDDTDTPAGGRTAGAAGDEDEEQGAGEPTEGSDDAPAETGRGRSRRRRGTSAVTEEQEDTADESDDDDDSDDDEGESGSSRRRRRRRRGGARTADVEPAAAPARAARTRGGSETRSASDEVTALKGSTRLEAKRQRRRDGRDAGRRRSIITEAEFLARRESVDRSMIVRERDGRTQIAVLEDGVLVEHYVSQQSQASMAGNVYLGRVQNVLPSMEAAFVDVGKGRNAVLYAGEVNWDAVGLEGQPRRIEQALKSGDPVLVQVTKDPIGQKGARLTSQITLAGRYLVYVPSGGMTGISRKLPDTERARLKKILREVVPESAGVIVRTAAEGASEEELRADIARLQGQWEAIEKKSKSASAPALLQGEPDLAIRVVRDIFNDDFKELTISGGTAWSEISEYVNELAPDLAERVHLWTSEKDVFSEARIDEQLAKGLDRKVFLPSGGSLVIDRTEAMTVVDVNTGKFIGSGGTLEETVTRNNLEAAEEIVRQLRLRDIGGIIVIDFIDMVLESNRDLVLRRLVECLGRDRTKHQVAEVTSLGLVQMTRKRVGQGLVEAFSETCEHCNGRGFVVHDEPNEKQSDAGPGAAPASVADATDKRARRKRGAGREEGAAITSVPVLPEARESVKATLATIAAAAAHAHEHEHDKDLSSGSGDAARPAVPEPDVQADAADDLESIEATAVDDHDERASSQVLDVVAELVASGHGSVQTPGEVSAEEQFPGDGSPEPVATDDRGAGPEGDGGR